MQFIDLKQQYQNLKSKIDERIQAVLDHGHYIMGPEVGEFETQLAQYAGANHAIGVANGTDAIQLALMAMDVGPGDAVFTTSFTFFATAEVISLVGAKPVFVDIDPNTYNICCSSLTSAIGEVKKEGKFKPKAIIAVDLFGLPADYSNLQTIANEHKLLLIEDAAQGFGGCIDGKKAGSFGDIATTSFFPAKPLGCYGDGGAVLTNNEEYAEKIKSLRVHGKGQDKYDNVAIGMNSRLDTIQAAVLLEKLHVFEKELTARNELAKKYTDALSERFITPMVPTPYKSAWAQYTLAPKSGERENYMAALKDQGIPIAVYYGKPMHLQKIYKNEAQYVVLNNSEKAASTVFSIPMHPYMSDADSDNILTVLLES